MKVIKAEYKPYSWATGTLAKVDKFYTSHNTGVEITKDRSGRMDKFRPFKNGKWHGRTIRFHENGRVDSIVPFKNGKKHGVEYIYSNWHTRRTREVYSMFLWVDGKVVYSAIQKQYKGIRLESEWDIEIKQTEINNKRHYLNRKPTK